MKKPLYSVGDIVILRNYPLYPVVILAYELPPKSRLCFYTVRVILTGEVPQVRYIDAEILRKIDS